MDRIPKTRPQPAVTVIDAAAVCPLCHTADAVTTDSAVVAGGWWRCSRCDQSWDAMRLAVRDAYDNRR
jgi:predicted Zn finger-like uncharacterized protein